MRTCAIVGCGRVVEDLHLPALAAIHGLQVDAFVDANIENAKRLAASQQEANVFSSHLELIKSGGRKADFVIVATPGFTHHPIVMDLIRGGFNLLVEKPLALRLDHVEEIQEAAKSQRVTVGVLQNYRYRMPVLAARHALAEGVVGQVTQVNATFHGQAIHGEATPWSWAERKNRVLLFEQCIHFLDLMTLFAGPHKRLIRVECKVDRSLDVTSQILALVEFESGATGIVDFQLYTSSNYAHLEVFGTANDVLIKFRPHYYRIYSGSVNPLDEVFFDLRRLWDFGAEMFKSAVSRKGVKRRALSHHLYFADYVKALESGTAPPVDIEAVLPTMKLADAIAKHVYGG